MSARQMGGPVTRGSFPAMMEGRGKMAMKPKTPKAPKAPMKPKGPMGPMKPKLPKGPKVRMGKMKSGY